MLSGALVQLPLPQESGDMGNKLLVVTVSEINKKMQASTHTLVFIDQKEGEDFIKNSGKTIISKQYAEVVCSYQAF